MKQFLKSSICFATILLIVYPLIVLVWGLLVPQSFKPNLINHRLAGFMQTRLKDVKNYYQIDILFLGSSHAYSGFDVRIFNDSSLTGFNLGSSGQTPLQTEVLLDRYLDQLNPKIIIFEVYPLIFTTDGAESTIDIVVNDNKIDSKLIRMILIQNSMKVYNTIPYLFLHDLFNPEYIEPQKIDSSTYIPGGYVEYKISYFKNVKYLRSTYQFNDKQLRAFTRILSIIKARNIKLLLVQTPVTSSLYDSKTNNCTFDSIMTEFGDYYNFNKILDLDDSLHFRDKDHLNTDGVLIFNRKLIRILKEK